MYKMQVNRGTLEPEKGRYAKLLEQRELENYMGVIDDFYVPEITQKQIPLGKVVTQVEMNNAEARSQLREMLEFQIREKERLRGLDAQGRERIYPGSLVMKNQLQL